MTFIVGTHHHAMNIMITTDLILLPMKNLSIFNNNIINSSISINLNLYLPFLLPILTHLQQLQFQLQLYLLPINTLLQLCPLQLQLSLQIQISQSTVETLLIAPSR